MKTSVLITNYNNGPLLRACIESVRGQVDQIIVYDDGSDNEDAAWLALQKDVTLISRPRYDTSHATNHCRGIYEASLLATGDIIFLLDGDDTFYPGKVGAVLKCFENPDTGMVFHQLARSDNGRPYMPWLIKVKNYFTFIYHFHCLSWIFPVTSAIAMRRSLFDDIRVTLLCRGYPLLWADTRLCLAAFLYTNPTVLSETLGTYNYAPGKPHKTKQARGEELEQRYQYFNDIMLSNLSPRTYKWRKYFSPQLVWGTIKNLFIK